MTEQKSCGHPIQEADGDMYRMKIRKGLVALEQLVEVLL
jgi:hypothetical protein